METKSTTNAENTNIFFMVGGTSRVEGEEKIKQLCFVSLIHLHGVSTNSHVVEFPHADTIIPCSGSELARILHGHGSSRVTLEALQEVGEKHTHVWRVVRL